MTTTNELSIAANILAKHARDLNEKVAEALRFARYLGHREPNLDCCPVVAEARAAAKRANDLAVAAHDAWMDAVAAAAR